MVSISVILITARPEYSIVGQSLISWFSNVVNCLHKQVFRDFELIVVDSLRKKRRLINDNLHAFVKKADFHTIITDVHPEHRVWLDRKRYNICGSLNTALMHAEGELIVRMDDCSECDKGYLQRIYDEYMNNGLWLQGMHIKHQEGKIVGKDSRIDIVASQGGRCLGPPEWMYGYATFTMEAALKVNGFDELFDGDKQQEDQDFGTRLVMAGYKDKFLVDSKHTIIEYEHHPIPSYVIDPTHPQIKCNYAIYRLSLNKNQWKANTVKLSESDIAFIKEESLRAPCSTKNHTYADNCEGELFRQWVDSQNLFSLRERQLEV